MRAQTVVIASYLAVALTVIVTAVLFVTVYPMSNSYSVVMREYNVILIVRQKTFWNPRDLALRISSEFGADYVYVEAIRVNIINDTVTYHSSYNITPVGTSLSELVLFKYHYSRLTRNGTLIIYNIEVGYK